MRSRPPEAPRPLVRLRTALLVGAVLLAVLTALALWRRPPPAATSTAIKPPIGETVNRQGETVPLERAGLGDLEVRGTLSGPASPQEVERHSPAAFAAEGGEALYVAACASCHMQDGRGASGAGTYPALAGNSKMQTPEYVVNLILRGAGGMPGFQDELTDAQVADIVNYVRQDLNRYPGAVNAPFVRPLRRPYDGPGLEGD